MNKFRYHQRTGRIYLNLPDIFGKMAVYLEPLPCPGPDEFDFKIKVQGNKKAFPVRYRKKAFPVRYRGGTACKRDIGVNALNVALGYDFNENPLTFEQLKRMCEA